MYIFPRYVFPRSHMLMFFLVVALSLLPIIIRGSSYYTVDSSQQYKWNGAYPQGCECMEDGKTKSACSLFRCTCTCDLKAGQCDYNCCCDVDCNSDQIKRFRYLNSCLPQGFAPMNVTLCYSPSELAQINPRPPLGGVPTAEGALSSALCVIKTNIASNGDYYTNTALQSSTVFQSPMGLKQYSYVEKTIIPQQTHVAYDQDDSIGAFYTTGLLPFNGKGYMLLPNADYTGRCNDNNLMYFERDQSMMQCQRLIPRNEIMFKQSCDDLSMDHYVSKLYLAIQGNLKPFAGVPTLVSPGATVLAISLKKITFIDSETGSSQDILPDQWLSKSCNTIFAATNTSYEPSSPCTFSSAIFQSLYVQTNTPICKLVVKSVFYIVTHSNNNVGTIDSIEAEVVVTDIPYLSSSSSSYTQSFGVSFKSGVPSAQSQVNGNLVVRKRSGNPGYLLGRPVLFGYVASGATVVNEVKDGLSMPMPLSEIISDGGYSGGGFTKSTCPKIGDKVGTSTVNYGYDISTGCLLTLNRVEMQSFCCQGSSSCAAEFTTKRSDYSNNQGLPYFFNVTSGYVGIYGNADPLDISQWIPLSVSYPTAERVWNDLTATCSNMITGINYKFLIARSGEKASPQDKIVSAAVTVVSGDVVLNVPYKDDHTTQSFPLQVTVSFVRANEEVIVGYYPPAPPVLFLVPYDVFYPFQLGAAAPTIAHASGTAFAAMSVVGLCLLLSIT